MLDTSKDSIVSGYKAIRDRPDESQNLKHFKVPVQLVIGSDDHSPSPDEALNISKEIPNATLVTMEKCGHAAPLEHPDRLNTLLSEWFKKKTGINPH
jgi:pimeloyl-ACP methyl ester carboxylesterase